METAAYLNLDLLFQRNGDTYWVRARNSLGSESSRAQSFTVPFTLQERQMLTGDIPDPGHFTPQQVGQRLYEALFQGEVRDLLVRSHEQARTMTGLRLRLYVNDAAELALLPWEYLYDATEARFLALTARLSIVRYLALGEPPQALHVDPPLRVLVVLANPADIFPPLDVEGEWQQLQAVFAPLVDQGIIELMRLSQPTRNALADCLEKYPVHVLHFVGHGNYDAASGEGGLYLVDGVGAADFVPASVLQVLLADTSEQRNALRLAFLNGCLTGRSTQIDPFTGMAQHLVQHGVPAVIAMQYSVTDGAATELAYRFYRALARGYPVDAALAQARKGIYIQGNYLEWGTPVLFLRAPDGQLFTVAGAKKLIPLLPDVESPYRGLEVFEAVHAPFYFGREDMIQRLLAKVAETNFVVVVGPSGSGKSSLVRAGLIPALAKGALTGSAQWAVATLRPGGDPLRALISALLQLGDPQTDYASRIAEVRRLANMLMVDELPLADLLDPLHERHSGLVLVIDQSEEVFTLCSDTQARDRFFAALLTAAAYNWIKVILTLRADFWSHVLDDKQLNKPADAGQVNVLVMTRAERRAAIEKPAHAVGRRFEEGLVSLILDELEAEPGELPLLEFALTELWARQSIDGVLTHAAYEGIGKVSGAIARRADEIFQRLRDHERRQVRTIFTRLVRVARPEEGNQDTKRRIILTELDEETQRQVQRLASTRLLVTGTDPETGQPTVEIAHEALIRSWQELKDWLNRDREFLLWRQRLRTLLDSWRGSDEDPDALLRGALLSEAELQDQNRPGDLDEQERAYIAASRQVETKRIQAETETRQRELENARKLAAEAEARRKAEEERAHEADARRLESEQARRTLRWRAFTLAVVALLAVIAAGIAFDRQKRFSAVNTTLTERNQQLDSVNNTLNERNHQLDSVNETLNQQNVELEEANTELAQKTIELVTTLEDVQYQSRRAQASALAASTQTELISSSDPSGSLALLLAKEAVLTTLAIDGIVIDNAYTVLRQAIDEATTHRNQFPRYHHTDTVFSAMFSPDGMTIVSAGADDTIYLWNAKTGKSLQILEGHTGDVWKVAFSPDGKTIVSASYDQTVRLWDVATGNAIHTLNGHTGTVMSAAFSPDGKTIVSAAKDQTMRLWDVATGNAIHTLNGHTDWVNSAAFSPDGKTIISASYDQTVRLWDVATGNTIHTFNGHTGIVMSAAFSPDGATIVSTTFNRLIHLWDTKTGKIMRTLNGHTDWVNSAAFSPDGATLVSASKDGTIKLWDVATGDVIRTLNGHKGSVSSAAFSPDGSTLVSASYDQTVRLWDVATGDATLTLGGNRESVYSAAFSPDGATLVSASKDGTIKLWDVATGDVIRTLGGNMESVYSAAFSPNGATIVSASKDGTIKLWDVATGDVIRTFNGHTDWVYSAAFSPDGATIVSASADDTIKLWNVTTGDVIRTLKGHTSGVNSAAFSPDGATIVSASADDTIKLWNVTTGDVIRTLKGHTATVLSALFSPDGTTIISAGFDSYKETIRLWDAKTGEVIHILNGQTEITWSVTFSPDGATIVSASDDDTVKLWDVKTGEVIRTLIGHTADVRSVTFSPDSATIVSASDDGTIRLWDAKKRKTFRTLEGHTRDVNSAAFSPDGATIVSASDDYTVRLWDAKMGEVIRTLEDHTRGVNSAVFSPDGATIVSASDDRRIKQWNVETGEVIRTLEGHTRGVNSAVFSPNGATIVSASDDYTVRLWDAKTGKVIRILKGHVESVNSAVFSPDGQTIVSVSENSTIRLWDVKTGEVIRILKGKTGSVNSAAFSSDGQTIVSASDDNTVRLWDAATGKERRIIEGHMDSVNAVAFSPDGQTIVSASDDNTVRLWIISIEEMLTLAEQMIVREPPLFTPAERERYGITKTSRWPPPPTPEP